MADAPVTHVSQTTRRGLTSLPVMFRVFGASALSWGGFFAFLVAGQSWWGFPAGTWMVSWAMILAALAAWVSTKVSETGRQSRNRWGDTLVVAAVLASIVAAALALLARSGVPLFVVGSAQLITVLVCGIARFRAQTAVVIFGALTVVSGLLLATGALAGHLKVITLPLWASFPVSLVLVVSISAMRLQAASTRSARPRGLSWPALLTVPASAYLVCLGLTLFGILNWPAGVWVGLGCAAVAALVLLMSFVFRRYRTPPP